MIDKIFAQQFAADWIGAWNDDDADRLLRHFSGDFEGWAPATFQVTGDAARILRGMAAVRAAWDCARRSLPQVRFGLMSALAGETNVTVYYKGVRARLAAETFCFSADLKVPWVLTMLGETLSAWPSAERRAA